MGFRAYINEIAVEPSTSSGEQTAPAIGKPPIQSYKVSFSIGLDACGKRQR
ncbi:hypothetical protein D1AOALGA4SA_4344 [Olavius algarvensis Delta 1 endosymbiont]|nr:hypothetical protein D1AOALGA4SA_4344 [Olavius algarvensis Delta 1 endosymbiont]